MCKMKNVITREKKENNQWNENFTCDTNINDTNLATKYAIEMTQIFNPLKLFMGDPLNVSGNTCSFHFND
jgi:hypothetical protein